MVAVKTLWVLWGSFSSNFSFNNGIANTKVKAASTATEVNKSVKYNRLRQVFKSTSFQLPKNQSQTSMSKSNTFDANGNQVDWLDDSESEFDGVEDGYSGWSPTEEDDFSDLDDENEALTCDVCDRSFSSLKRLADHQQKKRHFGCLQCDSILPSRQALDHHREQMDHFDFASDSDTTDFEEDSDEEGFDEERERLL